jgi:hypothetical protein
MASLRVTMKTGDFENDNHSRIVFARWHGFGLRENAHGAFQEYDEIISQSDAGKHTIDPGIRLQAEA